MRKKKPFRKKLYARPTKPPDAVRLEGVEYYLESKAIEILELSRKEMSHLLGSYKIDLHLIPLRHEEYSFYVKKSDVELARTLLDAHVPYMCDPPPKDLSLVTHIPLGWTGYDIDMTGWEAVFQL